MMGAGNTYNDKVMVLLGSLNNVTIGTSVNMTHPGTSNFNSTWIAPQAGCLYSLSGTQQSSVSSTATLTISVAVNGQAAGFGTSALSLTGGIQNFIIRQSDPPIFFVSNDVLTLIATVSTPLTLGLTAVASLIVLIGGGSVST